MSSLLNFDLGCKTVLSAFVRVVSQASWLTSIILASYILQNLQFISGLLKQPRNQPERLKNSTGVHVAILLHCVAEVSGSSVPGNFTLLATPLAMVALCS